MSSLLEQTTIKIPTEPIEDEKAYNFGMSLGLHWSPDIDPWYFSVGAESHLFLAGPAGIFLSTGRKEALSATFGVRW
jgi:hypothetical protein